MRKASDGRKEDVKIARKALLELKELLQGVYVMPISPVEVIEGMK